MDRAPADGAVARMTIDSLVQDVRVAWRGLWRAKAFTATAVLTLGVGVAGATILLALVQGVLLRPLPVRDQDRVIVAWKTLPSANGAHYPFGDTAIAAVGRDSRLFESVGGVATRGIARWAAIDDASSGYVNGTLVTGSFFDVLGAVPQVGRALTAADDLPGSEQVVVISNGLWQRRYGGSPAVIGRRLTIEEQPFTIVGVMPPDTNYPPGVELWRPTSSMPASALFGNASRQEIDLIARLKPGVGTEQASTELTSLTQQFEVTQPPQQGIRGQTPVVRSFEDVVLGNIRPVLLALLAAVALVLLIACANVANLLLMRGEGRRSELALREALGAARSRIVRQLLAESVTITLVATGVAVIVTWWGLQSLIAFVPDGLPRLESIRIDATVLLMVVGVALITSLLAGVVPAMLSARIDLVSQLRGEGRGVTAGGQRGRRILMVAQVALAVSVTAAAGLLTRSMLALQSVDTGVTANRLMFVSLAMPSSTYAEPARQSQFLTDAVASLEGLPQVESATTVNASPFSGGWAVPIFTAEGQTADVAATNPALNLEATRGNYFETLGIAIVRGRTFTDADRKGAPDVAIVSADVAARAWPNADPIGKRLKMGRPDNSAGWLTVVGVAAPMRYRDLTTPQATLYLPVAQFLDAAQTLAIRTPAPVDVIAALVRDRLRAIDANVQVMRVVSFTDTLEAPLAQPRFNAFLLNLFGAAALLLATIGHYAVIAAYVHQREREIALRVALGAAPATVRRLVFGEALRLAGLGAVIGLAIAALATRALRGLLFAVEPLDPITLIGAAALLISASVLASIWPLRRALRLDALALLRG